MYDRVTGYKDSAGVFHDTEEQVQKAELKLLANKLAKMGNPDEIVEHLQSNVLNILSLLAVHCPLPCEVFIGEKPTSENPLPPSRPLPAYHPPVTTSEDMPELIGQLESSAGPVMIYVNPDAPRVAVTKLDEMIREAMQPEFIDEEALRMQAEADANMQELTEADEARQ